MINKYLEKIAGFNGQSLKHLSNKHSILRRAIDNHQLSLQGALDPFRVARKVRNAMVGSLKGNKSTVDTFTKIERAQKRLYRVDDEIRDRKNSASITNAGSAIIEALGNTMKTLRKN